MRTERFSLLSLKYLTLLIVFHAALFFAPQVRAQSVTPYIINGSDVTNMAPYPSFAALYIGFNTTSGSQYCGATMINDNYALTAAHCIYESSFRVLYTYIVPQARLESDFAVLQKSRISEVYFPDGYIQSSFFLWPDDIAILKLETPISVGDQTSLLSSTYDDTYPGSDTFVAIGHGYEEGGADGDVLRATTLNFVSYSSCRAYYGSALTTNQICFDGDFDAGSVLKNSTCGGDSGGPVYRYNGAQYIQIGLTSFGPSTCGDPNQPVTSVFTEVSDYYPWITSVISGGQTPKYTVQNVASVRTFTSNYNATTVSGNTISTVNTSEQSSGGSATWWWLFGLVAVGLRKRAR